MDIFEKGESVPRTIECVADGTALDTANFLTIEVKVFNTLLRTIGTYTLAAGGVTRPDPTTDGDIFFVVSEVTTAAARALKYYYQLKTTETDATYPNNIRTRHAIGWCFELRTTV